MTSDARARLDLMLTVFKRIGFPLTVTSTDRTIAKQQELYNAGKTPLPGGASLHNYGRAADVIPARPGVTVAQMHPAIAYVARLLLCEATLESDHTHIEFPL